MDNNKFILINLNQTVSRFQLEEEKAEKNRWIIFGVIASLFLLSIVWFITINYSINNLISERQATINKLENEIESLKKEGQVELSKSDIESLHKLDNERIFWANKLLILSEITPPEMVITEIEYDKRKLIIAAITKLDEEKEFEIVKSFIELLKINKEFSEDFRSIQFLKSERIKVRGPGNKKEPAMIFKVEAKVKSKSKRSKAKRKGRRK